VGADVLARETTRNGASSGAACTAKASPPTVVTVVVAGACGTAVAGVESGVDVGADEEPTLLPPT
jgi:hypothetical protein